nr:zinc finger, CCHC-type [Tanacetum cinerariifolium]
MKKMLGKYKGGKPEANKEIREAILTLRSQPLEMEILNAVQGIFQSILAEGGISESQRRASSDGLGLLARLGNDMFTCADFLSSILCIIIKWTKKEASNVEHVIIKWTKKEASNVEHMKDNTSKINEIGSTTHFQCPMLKGKNYTTWAIRMQIILEANGLWEKIEPNEKTQADNKKDKTAIVFIYQALLEEQLLQITKHITTKAIWDALKTRHTGEERVQQARLQTLKSDFEMLQMKEDETIDTFNTKLTTLVNKAASLGHIMEDETLVRKLLNAVPDRYLEIVTSIEQYSDLSEMMMEEAIGRLYTYEERIKYKRDKQVNSQEILMFTQHESQRKPFREYGHRRFY